jgi:hypothetical protein
MTGMAACIPTGILQAAFEVYFTVPKTVHAAMIAPTYYVRSVSLTIFELCGEEWIYP